MTDELARLRERVESLEREHRRAFDDAQREADALFAQYQLSQLIASGGSPAELGQAVLLELVRLSGAEAGSIWLGEAGETGLVRIAAHGTFPSPLPDRLADLSAARGLASNDVRIVVLGEEPPATVLCLRPGLAGDLDADGLRVVQLARHELAVAFGGARLRETLERERRELQAVVDGATDIIVQVDEERRVVRLNAAGVRALGIEAEAVAGRTCADVFGCDDAGAHAESACPFKDVLGTGSPAYRETQIRGAHGATIRVAGGYSMTSASAGAGPRVTAILRDVTAVEALEQLREGFVATVSHELRTPLALVRGYTETLIHLDLDSSRRKAYLERIHEVTDRLSSLVGQILDVTHLDADPLTLERRPVSFRAVVARLQGDLAISGADARLAVDVPGDLPDVDIDAGRIGRVLENLVGNALKYAPGGSPIHIRAAHDGDVLVAMVDDEGIGIPEADRPLVAEPFHRAWNVRESRIPGTGLGLYICRRLVEAHGGRLWLSDRPDGRPGTRVSFTLPLAGVPQAEEHPVEAIRG